MLLDVDRDGREWLNALMRRTFLPLRPFDSMCKAINATATTAELEKLLKTSYFCDVCDLDGMNLWAAKRISVTVAEMLYKFPKMRAVCFYIGTESGLGKLISRLCSGDMSVPKDLSVHKVVTDEASAVKMGEDLQEHLNGFYGSDFVALADSYGTAIDGKRYWLFGGLVFKDKYFSAEGLNYMTSMRNYAQNIKSGYHPPADRTDASIVYHECGHLLDFLCDISGGEGFQQLFVPNKERIKAELSEYASTNAEEALAEAFAEFMGSRNPRSIALQFGRYVSDCYKTFCV